MIFLAALLAQGATLPPDSVVVYGPQPPPLCRAWTNARARRANFIAHQLEYWVLGLVTGLNYNGPPVVREGPPDSVLFGWLDRYCAANPRDQLIVAAIALSREVASRTH